MRDIRFYVICGLWIGVLILPFLTGAVKAQTLEHETWAPTEVIGGQETPAMWPMVAADPWGRVHAIWTQSADKGQPNVGLIMYRMKDQDGWHRPIDIMIRDNWAYSHPDLTFDSDNAYMIWAEWNGLYFSQAPSWEIGNAAKWKPKRLIVPQSGIDQSRIAVSKDGTLHIVYSRLGKGLLGDGNVYYLSSFDGGENWSTPRLLSNVTDANLTASLRVRMAVDEGGVVHVVWSEVRAPRWIGRAILYTHSLKNAETWSVPLELSEPNSDDRLWEAAPSIAVDHNGVVHLVWVCGEHTHRCYRSSSDGGTTWSPIQRILGNFESLAGWDSLIVDGEDRLHLIAQLRTPENVYHVMKLSYQPWGIPVPIVSIPEARQAHYPRVAITRSNELHVVMQPDKAGPIWYAEGKIPGNPEPVMSTPTITPTPSPAAISMAGPDSNENMSGQKNLAPTSELPPSGYNKRRPEAVTTSSSVVWGILPSVLLVLGVIILTKARYNGK